MTDAYDPT